MNTGSGEDGTAYSEWARRTTTFAFLGDGINLTEHQALDTIVSDFNTALGR